jgi:hypothetical protein
MDDSLLSTPLQTTAVSGTSVWVYVLYAVGALIVLALLIWGLAKLKRMLMRPEMAGLTREEIAKRWVQIRQTSTQGLMGAKLALLEADTLLDSGLKSLSMPGETLGERLKVACYKYPKLKNVWWAHKLRNSLAHDAAFQTSERQIRQALDEFERALKTLNVL